MTDTKIPKLHLFSRVSRGNAKKKMQDKIVRLNSAMYESNFVLDVEIPSPKYFTDFGFPSTEKPDASIHRARVVSEPDDVYNNNMLFIISRLLL